MGEIGIRELKQRASEILRQVREEKKSYAVTYRGRVVARLVPVEDAESKREKARAVLAEMDELAREIGAQWPPGVSATQAVKEQRREL